ncbi:MAG: hypothetical protein COS89_05085 [Deltaproteobacteria bacterium CG07_land_8_20_14_0_80_38_7]|nr:MAG: hypothetical protein COS89_05085 [Deltaproteobacteria bacterium CG07_land_8_20_14_0_80_38_7]
MNQPENRRKFARLDLALTVSYKVSDQINTSSDSIETSSSDISIGGLRLMTPTPLKNSTLLDLNIILPDDEENPIEATGKVIWQTKISSTSYETGVMINGINNSDKKRFMEFVFDQMSKIVTK